MEDLMLSLFVCLTIPIALSLLVFNGKSRALVGFMVIGIFICLFAGQVNGLIMNLTRLDTYTMTTEITPIVEELIKAFPILFFAFLYKPDRRLLLECALMLGLGFSILENAFYLVTASDISFIWAANRGLGTAMMHAVSTMFVGYGASFITIRKKTFITGTYALLFAAMIFHGTYNILVQSNMLMTLGIILPLAVFVPFSIYLYRSEKTTGEVK